MKKIFFSGIFLALLFIVACNKDEYTEKDATNAQLDLIRYQDSINQVRDSLNHLGGIIQYSVSVVPVSGSSSFLKSGQSAQGLSGAVVTVAQHGITKTDTAGASGICVFNDLRVGTVSVNVRATGYSTVDYIAEILPEDDAVVGMYYNTLRYAATMVPVFSMTEGTSTISGKITYESNLTNQAPEDAAGIKVIAMVDAENSAFTNKYFRQLNGYELGKYNAEIVQVAFTNMIDTTTTNTRGEYQLEMPSTADGLPIKLVISDVAVDQQLLLNHLNNAEVNGIQTVRTIFNTELTSGTASYIPDVPAAYAVVSAPTGTTIQEPTTPAVAQAVIGESGISSIVISNQGSGYTQAPVVKIKAPLSGFGEQAEAVAYVSNGKVTSIQITKPGSGYTSADIAQANFIVLQDLPDNAVTADADPNITYSIVSFERLSAGSGYKTTPEVQITSSTGSGAAAKAVMSGYITDIKVTNQGNNYTCPPNVIISGSIGVDATAYADMSDYNPIHSIGLLDYNQLFEETPSVHIITTSTGSGATAIAQLKSAGSIDRIEIDNAGLGYTEAPAILIVGGGGFGAVAWAEINTTDGSISNIYIENNGEGYTSDPVVQISAPPAGGVQAVGTAVRAFKLESITLTNPGSGYDISYNAGTYNNQPLVRLTDADGNDYNLIPNSEVVVRPNMRVENVFINNPGSEYTAAPTVTISPACGYGSGAEAVASILFSVDHLELTNGGSGYTSDAEIIVTIVTPVEGCSEQASFVVDGLGKGILSSITLNEGGDSYIAAPNVLLLNSSNQVMDVTVKALVSDGKIIDFDIVDNGGELNQNNYYLSISTHIGAAATSTALAYTESGKISFVTISNAGAGYAAAPQVSFKRVVRNSSGVIIDTDIPSQGFIDAEATATIEDGRVVSIEIINPGTGYYWEPVVVLSMGNELSLAKAGLTIVDGYITQIYVDESGSGYATAPTVTILPAITGRGSGATATAILNNAGGVERFVLTNSGSGYTAKNYPITAQGVSFIPSSSTSFEVVATKSYIRDIYLGTGKRTIEN